MRVLLYSVIMVLFISISVFAQVDTLQLVEIGSITAPSDIVDLYIEDLDADSLKEIILTTSTNVHIYNGITYEEIWTSPVLNHPEDLNFADINNDGLVDFSVKDSTNIYLYDPHTPSTIWTSPALDSTYKCYTIGDRNGDDEIDVAIVNKEIFTRINDCNNVDTAWIDLYNGTQYSLDTTIIMILPYYDCFDGGGISYDHWEYPISIEICKLGIIGQDENHIVVVIDIHDRIMSPTFVTQITDYGKLKLYNCSNLEDRSENNVGRSKHLKIYEIDGAYRLVSISDSLLNHSWFNDYYYNAYVISTDSIISYFNLWYGNYYLDQFNGFLVDNLRNEDINVELCYSSYDSLIIRTLDGNQIYWTVDGLAGLDRVQGSIKIDSLYSSKQIICGFGDFTYEYRLYDGQDGSLSAVINQYSGEISDVDDLHNDGNDEIFSIQDNELIIYSFDSITGNVDELELPQRFTHLSYPNPFNSTSTIEYNLPEAGQVSIEIYDLLGRKIETLLDKESQAGTHSVIWDASKQSSGIYFYRIITGDYSDTKKMVYLK